MLILMFWEDTFFFWSNWITCYLDCFILLVANNQYPIATLWDYHDEHSVSSPPRGKGTSILSRVGRAMGTTKSSNCSYQVSFFCFDCNSSIPTFSPSSIHQILLVPIFTTMKSLEGLRSKTMYGGRQYAISKSPQWCTTKRKSNCVQFCWDQDCENRCENSMWGVFVIRIRLLLQCAKWNYPRPTGGHGLVPMPINFLLSFISSLIK